MAAQEPPAAATRQLFVKFPAGKPRNKHEVEAIIAKFGQIRRVFLASNYAVAYISFTRTMDACDAMEKLAQRTARSSGLCMDLHFNRATKLLFIDAIPRTFTREQIITDVVREFSPFGSLNWIDVVKDNRAVYISFNNLHDAAQAVNALRGKTVENWQWEIEFHKVL
jgi:hypothetical protein